MKCLHSEVGVSIPNANGALVPCCKYDASKVDWKPPTIFDVESLDRLHQTTVLHKVNDEIGADLKHEGCHKCWSREEVGLTSRRQSSNNLFTPTQGYVQDMEIAIDFACNMMCRTCGSHSSSRWAASRLDPAEFGSIKSYSDRFRHVMDMTDLSKMRNVKIQGGEPFYSKNLDWFVDKLHKETGHDLLVVNLFTNASIFPDQYILNKLLSFKRIDITLSIDAIGDLFNVVRWGVEWDVVDTVIRKWVDLCKRHSNLTLCISSTVSIMNVNKMKQVSDYGKSLHIPVYYNFIDSPEHFSPYIIPLYFRKQWTIEGVPKFNSQLLIDRSVGSIEMFKQKTKLLDEYQKVSFASANPEIIKCINLLSQ